jgi:hypothetical protein
MMVSLVVLWGTINAVLPLLFNATAPTPTVPQLFTGSEQQPLALPTTSRTEMLAELTTLNQASASLVEVVPVAPSTTEPIGASVFVTTLTPTVPIAFTATINVVTPGSYRNEPWLALSVVDAATTLGGMLQWEQTMSTDLSPWFGEPVVGGEFKDEVIAGVDVRVLHDRSGTRRIIYGFIRPQVLLITTSENSFLNLTQNK